MLGFGSEETRDFLRLHQLIEDLDFEPVCRQDPDLFFPDADFGTANHRDVNNAKRVCNACPIRNECAAYGIKWADYGIYGGLTPLDRRTMRSRAKAKRLALEPVSR